MAPDASCQTCVFVRCRLVCHWPSTCCGALSTPALCAKPCCGSCTEPWCGTQGLLFSSCWPSAISDPSVACGHILFVCRNVVSQPLLYCCQLNSCFTVGLGLPMQISIHFLIHKHSHLSHGTQLWSRCDMQLSNPVTVTWLNLPSGSSALHQYQFITALICSVSIWY